MLRCLVRGGKRDGGAGAGGAAAAAVLSIFYVLMNYLFDIQMLDTYPSLWPGQPGTKVNLNNMY